MKKAELLCADCAKTWDSELEEIPHNMLSQIKTTKCTECGLDLYESGRVFLTEPED